ncbi:hypothetical protein GF343_03860 [Candidatus Woesearchaeota archaeon]|nr:hypothetical protein [Candidatus Woesearchaeota archaeon]
MDPCIESDIDALVTEVTAIKQLGRRNRDGFSDAVRTLYAVLPKIKAPMHEKAEAVIEDLARNVLYRVHDPKTVKEIADTLQDPRYQNTPHEFTPTETEEQLVLDKEEGYGTWENYHTFLESKIKDTKAFVWKKMTILAADYARISMMRAYEDITETTITEVPASREEAQKTEETA